MANNNNSLISLQGGTPFSLASSAFSPVGSSTLKTPTSPGTPIPFNQNANVIGNAINPTGPVSKPVSAVSSQQAVNKINNVIKPAIKTYDTQVAEAKTTAKTAAELDASATPDMKFLPGTGKPNPNYINPVTNTTTQNTTTTNPLEEAQTNEILHPGQTQLYNTRTGEQEWLPTANGIPAGYSKLNPKTRGDVDESIQDSNGNTIDKLSDGSYRRIDINGNYTIGTAQMFSDAKRVQDFSTQLDNARKGIYSPSQQAQLDKIKQDFDTLITKQGILNANLTGGTTIAGNRSGIGNQIVGQQLVAKTVTDGISAISDLVGKREGAIAAMKTAFEKDDMYMLDNAFRLYNTSSQQIQDQIDKVQAGIQTAKDKVELSNRSNAVTMGNKYIDTLDPIMPDDSPQQVQEKVRTSPTWQAEQKQKAGMVDQDAVDGAYAIWQKTNQLPTGFSAMSQNLKNAIYKKIGGNPDSVDEAVVNKAILTGKTKALATQENQYAGSQTSIKTLDKTLDLAKQYSDKVDRTGSPFAAKYALYLKGQVKGDADTAAFQALMKTAASEYAKIMAGSASSISGATVSSVENAESIINAEMSKGQIDEVLSILKKDANFRLDSQKSTIDQIHNDIKDIGGNTSSSSSSSGGDADFDWQ
jgi:hypothetical protein